MSFPISKFKTGNCLNHTASYCGKFYIPRSGRLTFVKTVSPARRLPRKRHKNPDLVGIPRLATKANDPSAACVVFTPYIQTWPTTLKIPRFAPTRCHLLGDDPLKTNKSGNRSEIDRRYLRMGPLGCTEALLITNLFRLNSD